MASHSGMDPSLSRSGSVSSIGSLGKRKRGGDDEESEQHEQEEEQVIVDEVIEIVKNDKYKVNKHVAHMIIRKMNEMVAIIAKKNVEIAYYRGRIEERELISEELSRVVAKPAPAAASYAGVTKMPPRVGRKIVPPKDSEKVVLLYPTDEAMTDSEVTKKIVKEALAPKQQGIQIRALRKVQKGGVAIESGTKKSAQKIRDIAAKNERIKAVEPKKILPKVMLYDVDRTLSEEDVKEFIFLQNLAEHGVMEKEMAGFKILYKVGRRDAETVNLVVEIEPKLREILLEAGRVYIDYDSCRIVDFYHISRCYRCQGYGHVQKFCKKEGGHVCSHCGREGHEFMECPQKQGKPSCVNCVSAKKPSDHKVGTLDCPMYKRMVEQRISRTHFG